MIVVTATLIFLMLIFAPLFFKADVVFYPHSMSATANVKVGAIPIFNESVRLAGSYLQCDGTVSTDVELKSIDKQGSVDLLKCITVEKFCMSFYNNVSVFSPIYMTIINALLAFATSTACNQFHCKFYSECKGTLDESCVRVRALINLSVAALSFCLLKQGVRKWKTCKSKK